MPTPERPHGRVTTPPNPDHARCYPSRVAMLCSSCHRRALGSPTDRRNVAIDYAAIADPASCPMFVPKVLRVVRFAPSTLVRARVAVAA